MSAARIRALGSSEAEMPARLLRQQQVIEAAARWAERDRRVRALLLKGSFARGEEDEHSDVDLIVVAEPGRLKELWATRRSIAEGLGGWLGGFDEAAWQAPYTFIGFCSGPCKVDLFFQEGQPAADPWLRDGFRVLVGPSELAKDLRERLARVPRSPDLGDFDSHAWDWLWFAHVKLRRPGEEWLVYVELVKFVETMLVGAANLLAAEPWRGVWRLEFRLPPDVLADVRAAVPSGPHEAELRRAVAAALDSYLRLRARLAADCGMPLNEQLAAEVLPVLRAATAEANPT
jgi:predicted nucleotidyltransferase